MERTNPEAVFDAFLRNANGDREEVVVVEEGRILPRDQDAGGVQEAQGAPEVQEAQEAQEAQEVTRNERPPTDLSEDDHPTQLRPHPAGPEAPFSEQTEPGAPIVLLTDVKKRPEGSETARTEEPRSVVALRSDEMMRLEAQLAVPDIAQVPRPLEPLAEGSEDGQIPAGELDRILSDMMVLVRYGHHDEVRRHLEGLTRSYPEDVLLLRRIVEFHVANADSEGAIDALFLLATSLFERRNTLGMRHALEQVLVIEPENRRAYKLLGLLEQRPVTATGH
ncbi:MAG: hypothetical protein DRJ42_30250 [Deltaproteobacteria bacterium]|nr:MAG: hypothetical protein DRJ42_30250 [Deltaproteobacteria bacterium]